MAMKVLFLSRWYPYPADNGSRLRIYHLIRQLSTRHEVSLVSFTSEPVSEARVRAMREVCVNVQTTPYRAFHPRRPRAVLGFLASVPRSVVDTYSETMAQMALNESRHFRPDVVIASQIDMAPYGHALPGRRILEEVEVSTIYEAFARQDRGLKRLRARLTWQKLVNYLRGLARRFNGFTVVSRQEYERVVGATSAETPVAIVPNGVDVEACAKITVAPRPDTLIYSGSLTYQANFDAVAYFLGEIFPLIREKRPHTKLFITGRLDDVPLDRLPKSDAVIFTGYLDDVRPQIAQSWVSVVPLRVGGGTRLKILESLALGTPVVSTSKGVEGLELMEGRDVLIADSAEMFAEKVVRVLDDSRLREALSARGRRTVAAAYDWRIIGGALCEFVAQIEQGGAG